MFSQQVILKISYSNSFLKTVLFKTNHEKYLYILTESNERIHQPNQPYSNTADKQDSDDFFLTQYTYWLDNIWDTFIFLK